jgi:catechol 2,3-dioxygenase-like lactoylglutathione lyase family enzyme
MKRHIGAISLPVRDYNDAISFYMDKPGFHLIEDTNMDNGMRWIRVAPHDSADDGTVVVFEDLYGNKWDLIKMEPSIPPG